MDEKSREKTRFLQISIQMNMRRKYFLLNRKYLQNAK